DYYCQVWATSGDIF
nr:immunoglobulin light chain junction region [Macaca mulatta]MOW70620.1 immunoglobulin light chain junction region [Macaca mulatta]